MHFTIQREALLKPLQLVAGVVERRQNAGIGVAGARARRKRFGDTEFGEDVGHVSPCLFMNAP